MDMLDINDFELLGGAPFGDSKGGYCYNSRNQHYYIKRANKAAYSPLLEIIDPVRKFENEASLLASNLSSIWEVCFTRFAKALMPEKVPGSYLCRDGNELLVATDRLKHFFEINYHSKYQGNTISFVDPPPGSLNRRSTIISVCENEPPKVTGLVEIMMISSFLGDEDYVNDNNIGLMYFNRWIARRIDLGCAGLFAENWDVADFLDKHAPENFLRHYRDDKAIHSFLEQSDFSDEANATLEKIAKFDTATFQKIWDEFKPLLLAEAEKLQDPLIRNRAIDYFKNDAPVAILKERQIEAQEYLATKAKPGVDSFAALTVSEAQTFEKWQRKILQDRQPAAGEDTFLGSFLRIT